MSTPNPVPPTYVPTDPVRYQLLNQFLATMTFKRDQLVAEQTLLQNAAARLAVLATLIASHNAQIAACETEMGSV